MIKSAALAVLAAAAIPALAGDLQTITIDFDDQAGGLPPVVTDGQFSEHATFSTEDNHVLLIFAGAGFVDGSPPNTLTAAETPTSSIYDSDIYIDFTTAVQNLTMDVLSDNDSGVIGAINVFHAGGSSTIDVIGNGDFADGIAMDLSSYIDVTRVELVNITDEFGLAIDNLVFDAPVPTPGTLALLTMAGFTASRRRR